MKPEGRELAYESVVDELLNAIPEVRDAYGAELAASPIAPPGPHVVFADILCPFVADQLVSKPDSPVLTRVFRFLEDLAKQTDPKIQEVIVLSFCDPLLDDRRVSGVARKRMGPFTLRACRQT